MARQEADQELRAALGEKANLDQVPTKTSQLNNDSGFIGTEQLQDYYTKTQTDEAISNAVSAKDDAKYVESEDGKRRIYGNGDVKSLSSAPGEYGPWTAEDGTVDETWRVIEISAGVFGWTNDSYDNSIEVWSSEEEALKAVKFTAYGGIVWTRSFVPGPSGWKKDGEVAVRYGRDFGTLSASRIEAGAGLSVQIDENGMKTAKNARIGFGQASDSGVQPVTLSPGDGGGIILDGVTFAQAPIYVDRPYVYDQKTRVATLGDVDSATDSKLSSYVSKTEVVPSQMIPGAAETAYSAMKAWLDGEGNEIATDYAKKTDLTAKQDKLPYSQNTGLYDISAFGAAQAAYVPWSGVENKQIASATEPGIVKVGKNLTIDADGTLNAEGGGSSSGGHTLVVKGFYKYGSDNPGHVYVDGLDVSYSVDSFNLKPLGLGNTVPDLYLSAPELKFYNQTMFFRNGRCDDDKGLTTYAYEYTLLTADTTVSVYSFYCLAAGTKILLANGSEKNIEDIGYDDQLLVWNFDEGRPGSAKPFWIKKKETAPYFWDIRFDDGTSVRACGPKGHEFFSGDRQDFVYGDELAGHAVLKQDGKTAKCVSSSLVKEGVDMYNLMTEKHVNCFANGVLAGCSLCKNLYGIEGLRFVKKPKKLRGYDEFEGEVPLWWFNAARYAESSSPHEKLVKYYKDRIGLMR